jgi:hypothetical protein
LARRKEVSRNVRLGILRWSKEIGRGIVFDRDRATGHGVSDGIAKNEPNKY